MTPSPTAFRTDDTARSYQLAVIALCVLALLAAAIALPPVTGLPAAGSGSGDGGGSGSGGGTGGEGGDGAPIQIEPGNGTAAPPGSPEPVEGRLDRECAVYLLSRPVPGSEVPVLVLRDGEEQSGVPVRFNGELVGETNERGVVTGEVPYREEFEVSVDVGSGAECAFVDHQGNVRESSLRGPSAGEAGEHSPARGVGAATTSLSLLGSVDRAGAQGTPERANYTVDGEVLIGVRGEPYPGDRVDVLAVVEGVPMRNAAVTVDGEQVARTDESGQATITVPDDGRESITLGVSRGDFAGTRQVDLFVLRVAVTPDAPLAIPGGEATVRATIDGEPVPNADVTVDGEAIGTTNARGEATFTLPADPTTTVAVAGQDQRASTSLWPAYLPTIGLVAVYLGVLAVAFRRDGVRGTVGVLAATGVIVGLFLVLYGLARGRTDLAIGGGVLAVLGAGILLWQRAHWRASASQGAGGLREFLAGLLSAIVEFAYEAAIALERFVLWAGARIRALAGRLRSAPRSFGGIAAAIAAWLATVPGRLLGLVRWVVRTPWRLLAWWRARGEDDDDEADEPTPATTPTPNADEEDPFSLREAWRRFARWVVPGPWRRRTPGEVARAAVSEGFPRDSVGEFTGVFRDVEYGERPLTEERREQAEAAFESLEGHREDSSSDASTDRRGGAGPPTGSRGEAGD